MIHKDSPRFDRLVRFEDLKWDEPISDETFAYEPPASSALKKKQVEEQLEQFEKAREQ